MDRTLCQWHRRYVHWSVVVRMRNACVMHAYHGMNLGLLMLLQMVMMQMMRILYSLQLGIVPSKVNPEHSVALYLSFIISYFIRVLYCLDRTVKMNQDESRWQHCQDGLFKSMTYSIVCVCLDRLMKQLYHGIKMPRWKCAHTLALNQNKTLYNMSVYFLIYYHWLLY